MKGSDKNVFDNHQCIKKLQEAGFNESQAEVLVEIILDGKNFDISRLVTSDQLSRIEERLQNKIELTTERLTGRLDADKEKSKKEIAKITESIDTKIAQSRSSTLRWLVGLSVTVIAGIAGSVIALLDK